MTANSQPEIRYQFLGEADELNYLSDMIRFALQAGGKWLSQLDNYLARYREVLMRCGTDDGSIILQDHWALLCEVEGNSKQAIEHRVREVELIDRLFSIGGPVGPISHEFLRSVLRSLLQDYLLAGDSSHAESISQRLSASGRL
jgi:hypothetical protein